MGKSSFCSRNNLLITGESKKKVESKRLYTLLPTEVEVFLKWNIFRSSFFHHAFNRIEKQKLYILTTPSPPIKAKLCVRDIWFRACRMAALISTRELASEQRANCSYRQRTPMCFASTLLWNALMALRCSRSLVLLQHPAGSGSAAPPPSFR